MKWAPILLVASLCFGAPAKKSPPPDKVHLSLSFSRRNGLAFPAAGGVGLVSVPLLGGGALASALGGLANLGTKLNQLFSGQEAGIPKTEGEMARMMTSPEGDQLVAMASRLPLSCSSNGQLEADLVWDPQERAYVVDSGTLVWSGRNNSRFQAGETLLYCNVSGGGTHQLKRDEVKVKFPQGDLAKAVAGKKGKDETLTYDLVISAKVKEEPLIGEGGWISGDAFQAREKYTTGGTQTDIKAIGGGDNLNAPPTMFALPVSYSAEEREIRDGRAEFSEAWTSPGGTQEMIRWRLGRPPPRVEIVKLEQKEGQKTADPTQVVFGSGKLTLVVEAKVSPPERSRELKWDPPPIGEVEGKVESRVVEPGLVRAEITYPKLPAENTAFGDKELKATLADQTGRKSFQVLFERDGKDHPAGGGKDSGTANWFFYWKQGAVPELDRFEFTEDAVMGGGYSLANRRLCVTQGSPEPIPGKDVTLRSKDGNHSYHLVRDRVEGIQAVAAVVRHEMKHKDLFDQVTWPGGKDPYWKGDGSVDPEVRPGNDYDQDSVPDGYETGSTDPWLDPFQACSYANFNLDLFFQDPTEAPASQKIQLQLKADNELLAIIAERKRVCREDQDWAFPGTRAKGPGN